jgi:GTP-sensing pleiotropic transcriptional regulator CodY
LAEIDLKSNEIGIVTPDGVRTIATDHPVELTAIYSLILLTPGQLTAEALADMMGIPLALVCHCLDELQSIGVIYGARVN